MEDVQDSPDKCVACNRPAYGVACEFCEEILYCSDECKAVHLYVIFFSVKHDRPKTDILNSDKHKITCQGKKIVLRNIRVCQAAGCRTRFDKLEEEDHEHAAICSACEGAKYCSQDCFVKELVR